MYFHSCDLVVTMRADSTATLYAKHPGQKHNHQGSDEQIIDEKRSVWGGVCCLPRSP